MKRVAFIISVIALILASGCKKKENNYFTIRFDSDKYELMEHNSINLSRKLIIEPESDDDVTIEWSVSDESVVMLAKGGLITALTPGTVTVMANRQGKEAKCTVVVKEIEIESYSLMGVTGVVFVNNRADIQIDDVTPANASISRLQWESDDPGVKPQYDPEYGSWYVQTDKPGSYNLTAKYKGLPDQSFTLDIEVNSVKDITISPDVVAMRFGQTKQLTATITKRYPDEPLSYPENLVWESDDNSVATISQDGVLTAKNVEKSCNVLCHHMPAGMGDIEVVSSVKVTVTKSAPLVDFSLDKSSMKLYVNDKGEITVSSISPTDSDPSYIEWRCEPEDLVSLSLSGKKCTVKANTTQGKGKVIASCNGVTRTVDIAVSTREVENITLTCKKGVMFGGESYAIPFTYTPANASLLHGFQFFAVNRDGADVGAADATISYSNGSGVISVKVKAAVESGNYRFMLLADNTNGETTSYLLNKNYFAGQVTNKKIYGAFPMYTLFSMLHVFQIVDISQYATMTDVYIRNVSGKSIVFEKSVSRTDVFDSDDKICVDFVKNTVSPYYADSYLNGKIQVTDIRGGVISKNFSVDFESLWSGYKYHYRAKGITTENSVDENGTINVPQTSAEEEWTQSESYPWVGICVVYYDYTQDKYIVSDQYKLCGSVSKSDYASYSGKTKTYTIDRGDAGSISFKCKYATYKK